MNKYHSTGLERVPSDDEGIGQQIRYLRRSRKMTQDQLSRLSQVPFATINRLEKNKANPTLATLEKLLYVFGYQLSVKRKTFENEL